MTKRKPFLLLPRRLLVPALLAFATPARAQAKVYQFDEKLGQLTFTARHFGLMRSSGSFGRFNARVLLDPTDPSRAEVTVAVATGSIDLAWPGGVEMLRSPAYFASEEFPMAHFTGVAVGVATRERFTIAGNLTMRGITKPLTMEARLLRRVRDPAQGGEVAEFSASGEVDRTDFGMVEDRTTISDRIVLAVQVRLLVGP